MVAESHIRHAECCGQDRHHGLTRTHHAPCTVERARHRGRRPGRAGEMTFDLTTDRRKIETLRRYRVLGSESAPALSQLVTAAASALDATAGLLVGLDERGPRRVSPFFIPSALINLVSGQVSIKYGFKGPNHAVVTACSTGAHAIGDASRIIKYGDADVMIAGGAEAAICRIGMAGFAAARALSTGYNDTPEKGSRPWDKGRDGFVMGEGSGVLVLEEYEHAKARGAKIYGEIKGYGMSGDAHHITAPADDGDGGFRAMKAALNDAGLTTSDVDYVNAHGTSTPLGDVIEAGAVSRLFKDDLATMSMSSTKSATGHLLGAAGAIEAIYSIMACYKDAVPPTLNLDDPADEVAGIDLVPHHGKAKTVRNAMSNSFGFGGTNASLIVGKAE